MGKWQLFNKRSIEEKTNVSFGKNLEIISFLMSFSFFFSLLLFVYYNRYQADPSASLEGEKAFQPWVYLGSSVSFYLLHEIYRRMKQLWVVVFMEVVVIVGSVLLYPIASEKYLLGITLALYGLADFVRLGKLMERNNREMQLHFVEKSHVFWGIGMLVLLILHFITARHGRFLPVSSMLCMIWMLGAYFVYLVLFYYYKYKLMFCKYFEKRKSMDCVQFRQVKRVLLFVFFGITALVSMIFLLSSFLTKVFEPYLNIVVRVIQEVASIAGISVVDSKYASWFNSGSNALLEIKGENHGEIIQQEARNTNSLRFLITGLLLLFLVLFVLLMFYLLFRKVVSSSAFLIEESDEIRVVDAKRERQAFKGSASRQRIGRSTKEQVRRNYRKLVRFRSERVKITKLGKLTSREIEQAWNGKAEEQIWIKEITAIYDQARYSESEVEPEKAAKVRALCQEMRSHQSRSN